MDLFTQRREEANNMKAFLQSNEVIILPSVNDTSKQLERVWRAELDKFGVGPKSIRLQNSFKKFNKEHYPVRISNTKGVDYFSKEPYSYGEIDFSKAGCGWTDSNVFHNVHPVSRRYVPNDIGKQINIKYSRGGGSAFYEFDYTPVNIQTLITALQNSGYKTQVV